MHHKDKNNPCFFLAVQFLYQARGHFLISKHHITLKPLGFLSISPQIGRSRISTRKTLYLCQELKES